MVKTELRCERLWLEQCISEQSTTADGVGGARLGECARELELEFPDGGSGPRLRRLSLCCAASGGPRWCSQAAAVCAEREGKLGHSLLPRASSTVGDLRSEERGDAFLRFLRPGTQNRCCGWVSRWSRYLICKSLCATYF